MPSYDRNRIADLEGRIADAPPSGASAAISELEMLADLYLQADSYVPALETIQRLLELTDAAGLSFTRRAALELKMVSCRLARGEGAAALAQCRELIQREAEITSPAVRGALHMRCSDALVRLARYDESRERAEHSLAIAEETGDLALSADAVRRLATLAYRTGDLMRARDLFEEALALYRRLGDDARIAGIRNDLGLIHKQLCEWDAAITHLRGALEVYARLGRLADSGTPLQNLGIVYQKSGDWTRALEYYQKAEHVFLQVSDHLGLAQVGVGIGNVARLQRRFTDAETAFLAALERARAHDARREEVLALEFLGEMEFDRGQPELALARYHEALAIAQRVAPDGDLVVEIERRRAEALCVLGRLDDADAACERARRLSRLTDDRLEHGAAHRVAGVIALARGQRAEAIQAWNIAARLLADCRERHELARTLLALGRVADDPAEARRHLYRASALFAELASANGLEEAERELRRVLGPAPEPPPTISRPGSLLGRRHRAPSLVAHSHAMRRVESLARRAAATELSVLVTGETGTGKELIARTIHGLSSHSARPFLAVNCGALRVDLALSQLFGHRKGAFTGAHTEGTGLVEAAHGGTLFLDEVGELPPDVQVTLLRFLESGEYLRLGETQVRRADVRVIAATNRALRDPEGDRLFRRDLLFRLNEIEIELPALRDRWDDILPLARHFLTFYGGIDGPRLGADAEAVLGSYPWPGNVRELENVMKRIAALHPGNDTVDAAALIPFLENHRRTAAPAATDERADILAACARAGGNRSRMAELLGVSRKTLYARLKRLNLRLP